MKIIEVTKPGLEKMKSELEELKRKKRPEVIARIKTARALGDLSENSEWEEARNEQSFIEGRVEELEGMIKNAKVIGSHKSGVVDLGSSVTLLVEGESEEYEIVSSAEADPLSGKISSKSPLGKALIGTKIGTKVSVTTPSGGSLEYTIKGIK